MFRVDWKIAQFRYRSSQDSVHHLDVDHSRNSVGTREQFDNPTKQPFLYWHVVLLDEYQLADLHFDTFVPLVPLLERRQVLGTPAILKVLDDLADMFEPGPKAFGFDANFGTGDRNERSEDQEMARG